MITVTAASRGRADAVLAAAYPEISRARLQRLIAAGGVQRNGEQVRKAEQVEAGDVLTFELPETPHEVSPSGLDLPMLYEDAHLAAIDKPAGLAVHGAPGDTGPSVARWWLEQLGARASAFDVERPGIVHRLDKETTGVLLLAKTPSAQALLSGAFEAREAKKSYLALCDGVPTREHAVIDSPIGRHPADRMRMALVRGGREARTEYEVLYTAADRSLLLVRPATGRTHQIRVHLAAIGAPVRYDRIYGKTVGGRQLLHAWQLLIPHPEGGLLTITAPMPDDFADDLRAIGEMSIADPYCIPQPATLESLS